MQESVASKVGKGDEDGDAESQLRTPLLGDVQGEAGVREVRYDSDAQRVCLENTQCTSPAALFSTAIQTERFIHVCAAAFFPTAIQEANYPWMYAMPTTQSTPLT